jgi:hypothetical protein
MKDYLGNDIDVGDTIVCAVHHGRNSGASLVKCVVDGFTDKFVKAMIPDYTGHVGVFNSRMISPKKVVVVEKK